MVGGGVSSDSFDILCRFANGDESAVPLAREIFRRGWEPFLRAEGSLPLERCLGVSRRAKNDDAKGTRNYWLGVAHRHCEGVTPWAKSVTLADELGRFQAVIWPSWCDFIEPPAGSSELRNALFHAMRAAGKIVTDRGGIKMPNTARGLHGIICGS
jgi:hypothetical protein